MGDYWRSIRKQAGYSRGEVARKLGIQERDLAHFEQGLISPLDLPEHFIITLAEALSVPGAYETYLKKYRPT